MLVVAPLMHGNAQWVMWNAFMMAGTAVLYTEHRYDPDRLWRLVGDERVVSMGLVGDAMARPLAEALATAPPGTYDTSSLLAIGSGGAMLSSTVKDELKQQLPNVMVMDRFGSSESGAQGAVEEGASGPRFVMSDDTSVLDDDLQPARPRRRADRSAGPDRADSARLLQGPGQDRSHLPGRRQRGAVVGPR